MTGSAAAEAITEAREDRLLELMDAARREQVVADALDALVRVIAEAPVPVQQFSPVWLAVEARLRRDVIEARKRAERATERVEDVRSAQTARERWTPKRTPGLPPIPDPPAVPPPDPSGW